MHGGVWRGVSSKGCLAFFVNDPPSYRTDLVLQPLDATGQMKGAAVVAASLNSPAGGIAAADVTNTLSDGRRFVVYVSARRQSPDIDPPDVLSLRYVDRKTGQPLGDPTLLKTFRRSQGGTVRCG